MDYLKMGHCFSVLHRKSQLFIVRACERLQLTYSEYILLIRLYEKEGVSQETLAELLDQDKAVVTRTVNMLEKKELIQREKDQADRRVKRVYLTDRAKDEKSYLLGVLRAWIRYLSEDMSEEELQLLAAGYERSARRAANANIQGLARTYEEYYAGNSPDEVE